MFAMIESFIVPCRTFATKRYLRLTKSFSRGTQTISVNFCSKDLLSPMIFKLKYEDKLEFSSAQIFVIWEKQCLLFSER